MRANADESRGRGASRRQFLGRLTAGGAAAAVTGRLPEAEAAPRAAAVQTKASDLELVLSCQIYDRTAPLIDGRVKPEGLSLRYVVLPSDQRHHRMLANHEFDVSELSLSSYFVARSQGAPFKAIPIFPHRRFRHGYVYVNSDAGIEKPKDLEGRRVGLRRYQNTASTWMRGILADDYGLNRRAVNWRMEDPEEVDVSRPDDLPHDRLPEGRTLTEALRAGEIDAAISGTPLPLGGRIQRLFPNYKELELDYYRRTGIFPPMHTVVVKEAILAEHPWVATSLWKAFDEAKALCYDWHSDQRRSSLAWAAHAWEEQRSILGDDPWPHDLESNRKALETLSRYQVDDGLTAEPVRLDDHFIAIDA